MKFMDKVKALANNVKAICKGDAELIYKPISIEEKFRRLLDTETSNGQSIRGIVLRVLDEIRDTPKA